LNRKIIHVDVDAFFAAVEQMDNPQLMGKPVIVGGTSSRGVVSTCSYEARAFGVHSAMPTFMAKQLCPNGIFVPGRHERYAEISHQIFSILQEVSYDIEKVSIDEAYLDVTRLFHSPRYIGEYIKRRILAEVGIKVSVGISYNKFLAKLASEWDKPDGLFVIEAKDIPDILKPLPILKIHGLGKKSAQRLNKVGIYTIEDLFMYSEKVLIDLLGSMGEEIYWRIRGVDERTVGSNHQRKSIGKETTFSEDIWTFDAVETFSREYLSSVCEMLVEKGLVAKTVTIKVKYADFSQITRSRSLEAHSAECAHFKPLLHDLIHHIALDQGIRLMGITLSGLIKNDRVQIEWFDIVEE
jgi:DNA polymerase-4